jgi:DNA-binding NarL/FixJ family response regulator
MAPTPEGAAVAIDEERLRVLIADDNEAVREELTSYLENEGFDVVGSVGNGLDAFQQAASIRPDVVLMDLHMPGMDGIAAMAIIKSHAPEMPVVVLTAFSKRDNKRAAELTGAASFLDKDAPLPELVQALRSAAARGRGSSGD